MKKMIQSEKNNSQKLVWIILIIIVILGISIALFLHLNLTGNAYSINKPSFKETFIDPCINGCDVNPTTIYSFGFEDENSDDFTFTTSIGTHANFSVVDDERFSGTKAGYLKHE